MRCNHCGSPLADNSKFCTRCGQKVTYDAKTKGSSSLKKICIASVSSIVVVAASLVVYFGFIQKNGNDMAASKEPYEELRDISEEIVPQSATMTKAPEEKSTDISEKTAATKEAPRIVRSEILIDPVEETPPIQDYQANAQDSVDGNSGTTETRTTPFYGIYCSASKDPSEAQGQAEQVCQEGFDGQVVYSPDWSNLNQEPWYCVTAGIYDTEQEAKNMLSSVQASHRDAYVKYSGDCQNVRNGVRDNVSADNYPADAYDDSVDGNNDTTETRTTPFYGIYCSASKDSSEAQKQAEQVCREGFDGQIVYSPDWSNLNQEPWYCVTAGIYDTEQEAKNMLPSVQASHRDAYVKYSGDCQNVWNVKQ